MVRAGVAGKYFSQDVARKGVPTLVNEYRKTWAQILAGIGIFWGLYFTWRRVEISEKTLETQQDQQVTERFTRAIDQLGATDDNDKPRLEIRLGSIYALERIARDSPERDYSTVMEILMAYLRMNALYFSENIVDLETLPDGAVGELTNPPADVRAILEVIGRREEHRVPEESRILIDLRGTNFAGATFDGADFRNVDLRGANFYRAKLVEANLEGVDLNDANLSRANFASANLGNTSLQRAELQGANFRAANFESSLLASTDLMNTFLPYANLYGANFFGANLEGTILIGADLRGASFEKVKGLTQKQIEQAHGDAYTTLPENITRPAAWNTENTRERKTEDNLL